MDIEGQKLRDTFVWNKNEQMLQPEQERSLLILLKYSMIEDSALRLVNKNICKLIFLKN